MTLSESAENENSAYLSTALGGFPRLALSLL